mmetsp:Transcript_12607/g.23384  ORF Transcript_12607/g.23384 Transcript_12607/m.23384 type:complete len:682 (-) Transcript_12607:966-3011(-)
MQSEEQEAKPPLVPDAPKLAAASEVESLVSRAVALEEQWEVGAAHDWAATFRVATRSVEDRRKLRENATVRRVLAKAMQEEDDPEEVFTLIAIAANLVVDDEEEASACQALLDDGVISQLLRIAKEANGDSKPNYTEKVQRVCAIAIGNLARQLGSKASETFAANVNRESNLVRVCIESAQQAASSGTRENALSNLEELFSRSVVLRDDIQALVASDKPGILHSMLSHGPHRLEAVKVVQTCVDASRAASTSGTIPSETVRAYCAGGLTAALLQAVRCGDQEEVGQEVINVFLEFAKVAVSSDGQIIEKEDFSQRVAILIEHGLAAFCVEELTSHVESTGSGTSELLIAVGQLSGLLATGMLAQENTSLFNQLVRVALNCVKVDSTATERMLQTLRSLNLSQPEQKERANTIRADMLPYARMRLTMLSLVNSLSSNKENCPVLADIESLVPLCVQVAENSFDFDVEACRYSLNILRNLALDVNRHRGMLDPLETGHLGGVLVKAATQSIDQSTAGLAAATLRLLCVSHDPELLGRLLCFPGDVDKLVAVATEKVHPLARVEIARTLAHLMWASSSQEGTSAPWGSSLHTGPTVKFVAFLLQSEQHVLYQEALEAFSRCPAAVLQGQAEATLVINLGAAGSDEKREVSLVERVREILKALSQTSNQHQLTTLAEAIIAKLST